MENALDGGQGRWQGRGEIAGGCPLFRAGQRELPATLYSQYRWIV